MRTNTTILTGITPSGTPHLGNYIGAIKPSIEMSQQPNTTAYYFIADYHSLIKLWDPKARQKFIYEIAASWLALGLNPDQAIFYRQSQIPQILELHWILSSIASKGLMNRAHAYKSQIEENLKIDAQDPDAGITMGLFSYPILMSADILIFHPEQVPVGKDQIQHVEMARDIASRFNHIYNTSTLTLPNAYIESKTQTILGLDGRKMSKSYQNTIPLFTDVKNLRKLIMKIQTNSLRPGEPKDPDTCTLFNIYQAISKPEAIQDIRDEYRNGIAWGEMKQQLFEALDTILAPARERYEVYINDPKQVELILKEGSYKAQIQAETNLSHIKNACGMQ